MADRTMLGQMLETFVYGELRRQTSGVGEVTVGFGDGMFAVPIAMLWG
jgi:hypothetical protein